MIRGFEVVKDVTSEGIILPKRSTTNSAGYDFYSPVDFNIAPGESIKISTCIKAKMQNDEVLFLFIRSSIGIKKGLMLMNGTGIIDSDYYGNKDNDGNIIIALKNISGNLICIDKGEKICQGVFLKYLVADNDNTVIERAGGIGSTS